MFGNVYSQEFAECLEEFDPVVNISGAIIDGIYLDQITSHGLDVAEVNCHGWALFLTLGLVNESEICIDSLAGGPYFITPEIYPYLETSNKITNVTSQWNSNSTHVRYLNATGLEYTHTAIISPFQDFPASEGWVVSFNGPKTHKFVLHQVNSFSGAFNYFTYNGSSFLEVDISDDECPQEPPIVIEGPDNLLVGSSGLYSIDYQTGYSYDWKVNIDFSSTIKPRPPYYLLVENGNEALFTSYYAGSCGMECDLIYNGIVVGTYYKFIDINSNLLKNETFKLVNEHEKIHVMVIDLKKNSNYSLKVVNLAGQIIYSKSNLNSDFHFSLSDFEKGIYILQISNQKEVFTEKIFID